MKNAWYYLQFYFKAWFTGYFKKEHNNLINKEGYELTFNDEFDKPVVTYSDFINNGLDWSKWDTCSESCVSSKHMNYKDDPPNTYVVWKPNNVWINENGLVLMTDLNDTPGKPMISDWDGTSVPEPVIKSGEITTKNSFTQTYGFFEVRMKAAPRGGMSWSCPWLLSKGGWLTEIDFGEFEGVDSTTFTNTIWRRISSAAEMKQVDHRRWAPRVDLSESMHVYGLDWQPDYITFYLDNLPLWTYKGNEIPSIPMFVFVGMAVGRGFNPAGIPQEKLKELFPAFTYVDYVRVYKKL